MRDVIYAHHPPTSRSDQRRPSRDPSPVERKLRALSVDRRAVAAVRLAEIVEPFGVLAALTPGPLSTLADEIRRPTSAFAVEQTRQALLGIPVLQKNEEPDGPVNGG